MKSSIQIYGMTVVLCLFVMILPQLLGYAIAYKQCNQVASLAVEIIEVNEGIRDGIIDERLKAYGQESSLVVLSYNKEELTNNYFMYQVSCSQKISIPIINVHHTVKVVKRTKRVIY